jgi:hypothetical protein
MKGAAKTMAYKFRTIDYSGSKVYQVKPVIKISLDGILLYANNTGIDFLDSLSNFTKRPAINYLLETCPTLLDPHCNLDISLQINDMKYFFSVVAFKEAGYVGLYGYRQVHLDNMENSFGKS